MKKIFLYFTLLLAMDTVAVAQGLSNKETFTVNGVSFKMVSVEGGTFNMGATEDQGEMIVPQPVREATVGNFSIGETEVTQELWEAVMGTNPSYPTGKSLPVNKVSWNDCQQFIKKLNKLTGKSFRLPSEAEWEYAARGGKKDRPTRWAGSNNIDEVGWYGRNSGTRHLNEECSFEDMRNYHCTLHPVATKLPNELRIYDMTGNIKEWTSSKYIRSKYKSERKKYILKGGCYWTRSAIIMVIADIGIMLPKNSDAETGLRLALSE